VTKNPTVKRGRSVADVTGRPRRALPLVLVVLALLGACQLGETEPPAPVAEVLEGPALLEGSTDPSPERGAEAARLVSEAETALAAGDPAGAVERTRLVADRFGDVPGTAVALLLEARAEVAREEWAAAERVALRFLERSDDDEARSHGTLVLARARLEGELPGGIESLFLVPAAASAGLLDEAEELAWKAAAGMEVSALRDLVEEAPRHPRLMPVFLTELGVRRALLGDSEGAGAFARDALALEPGERTRLRAEEVMEGRIEGLAERVLTFGAMFSTSGPPSLQQLSARIRAGVEVALAGGGLPPGATVSLRALDDGGAPQRAASIMTQLEGAGMIGMIGPLLEPSLDEAARARRASTPMISPTARIVPRGQRGVFSLNSVDPSAYTELAALALRAGVRDLVILHPRDAEMDQAAGYFQEAYQAAGGTIRRTLTYALGTTTFEEPFAEVRRLRPAGLVLLLPPGEIELVVPQVAYYGVDDMEIAILGSEAFASPSVLQEVNPRHTEGVLTVTAREPSGEMGPGWAGFVREYEEHFQRTLRDPTPALGYDAARLLMYAVREGGEDGEEMIRALEAVRDYPGATGLISVIDGRIQRQYRPVRIENRQAVPFVP